MLHILIGHLDTELPEYDGSRYDVRVVRHVGTDHRPPATISEMLAVCPSGWMPDVYYHAGLIHFPIPEDIEFFPGLTATNIQDWHRGGRATWAAAGFFDLIATERNACALLRSSGYDNAMFARFWGVNPAVHRVLPDVERDIDVLFVGSINPEIWLDRNLWLDRLARQSGRYRVLITSGHYGEHYVRLTNRAKIVFNRSVNGCANQRAYDAPACGALVFNEAENEELRATFVDNVHCVYYTDADFEQKLDYYLSHEKERQRIADAGRDLVLEAHTEQAHLAQLFAMFESNLDRRAYRRAAGLSGAERCRRKALQIYSCSAPVCSRVAVALLDQAGNEGLDPYLAREGRAALHGWAAHYLTGSDKIRLLTAAIDAARLAARTEPRHALSHMTLAFLLLERADATQGAHPTERNDLAEAVVALSAAAERCEAALQAETGEAAADIDGFGYPRWNDDFDVRVESAYLLRGADPSEWARWMRRTIAWRCRRMLRDLAAANDRQDEIAKQAVAAVNALPSDPEALLYLARYAATVGDLEHSLLYYRTGLERSPLWYAAWPEYAAVLEASGQSAAAKDFVAERNAVIDAIPALIPIRPALLAAVAGNPEHGEKKRE